MKESLGAKLYCLFINPWIIDEDIPVLKDGFSGRSIQDFTHLTTLQHDDDQQVPKFKAEPLRYKALDRKSDLVRDNHIIWCCRSSGNNGAACDCGHKMKITWERVNAECQLCDPIGSEEPFSLPMARPCFIESMLTLHAYDSQTWCSARWMFLGEVGAGCWNSECKSYRTSLKYLPNSRNRGI